MLSNATLAPLSMRVQSYVADPGDAVTVSAKFTQLPDGTIHVSEALIDGTGKEMKIEEQECQSTSNSEGMAS